MDELLAKYARDNDASALARLIEVHIGWAYASALRQVRDHHLAEDVTQSVFLLLARKAAKMPPDTRLNGWLFNTLRFIARDALKLRRRRTRHERHSADTRANTETWWQDASPVLDEAVGRLARADRELILGRFYRDQTYEQLAAEVNLSSEAIRKRIGRALQELRGYLEAKAGELPEELDQLLQSRLSGAVAPDALVVATIASVGTGGSAAAAALTAHAAKAMTWIKVKAITAAVAAMVAVGTITVVAVNSSTNNSPQAASPSTAQVATSAPAAATSAMPAIAVTPQRESGAYVSFAVVVDEPLLVEMRAEASRSIQGNNGSELLVLDDRQVNQILLARRGNGVLWDAGPIMCRTNGDASRQWSIISPYPQVVQAKLADGRTTAEIEHRATYQAATSGNQVRVMYAGWARSRTAAGGAAQQPGAFSQQQVYEISQTLAAGQAAAYAVPAYAQGNERLWLLWIVQTFGADVLDVRQLGRMAQASTVNWLNEDPARLLLDARRAVLWESQLPQSYPDKWEWALPDAGRVSVVAVSDYSISKLLAWAPDGGRTTYRHAYVSDMDGPVVHYATTGPSGSFPVPPGTTSLRVGFGHGAWKRIIDAPLAAAVEKRVDGRLYRVIRYNNEALLLEWDNDPALDVRYYAIGNDGKPSQPSEERPELWRAEFEQVAFKTPKTVRFYNKAATRIVVETRPRLWHTFEGICTKPAVPAPSDAQVLASFSKPLDAPIPPRDADETPDMFTKLHASTIYFDGSSPAGLSIRWFGDSAGRFYSQGQGYTIIFDGSRALWWMPGERGPLTSRWAPEFPMAPKLDMLKSMCNLADQYEPKADDPEQVIDGAKTRLTKGMLKGVPNTECSIWRDSTGRVMRVDIGNTTTVNVRYDLPADPKWFAMDQNDLATARDIDAAALIVQKLCDRPAISQVTDGGRILRLHEVTPGPDGLVYICYSAQLLPEAAKALPHTPRAMLWGRGNIVPTWDDSLRPYASIRAAYIHTPDRSVMWRILVPNPKCQKKDAWTLYLDLNLSPFEPESAQSMLKAAGFPSFNLIALPLPATDPAKAIPPTEWLTHVCQTVRPYVQAATVLEFNGAPLVRPGKDAEEPYLKARLDEIRSAASGTYSQTYGPL